MPAISDPADGACAPEMNPAKKPAGFFRVAYRFLSGLGLATVLLLILGILTWLATLEQIDHGLYETLNKYFDWKSVVIFPEVKGIRWPIPLPGGYWTGALLFVNLLLGGVVHIRKGWKHIGNLIAHAGILLMLLAGGVAHHFSERGHMPVSEGETSNVAEDYFEYALEVAEIKDGKPSEIRVIRGKQLTDLTGAEPRAFRFADFPFELKIAGYMKHAIPVNVNERAPSEHEQVRNGYFLRALPAPKEAEASTPACHAMLLPSDGSEKSAFLLAGASFHPFTAKIGGRTFTFDLRKRQWVMPFSLRLNEFTAEFHPGTQRPKKFVSKVTRSENGNDAKVTIQMNEPMRYKGLTFFQASYGPQGAAPGQKLFSVFEVVKNPADKWPEYSLYVVTFGMLVTFLIKFAGFVGRSTRKKADAHE